MGPTWTVVSWAFPTQPGTPTLSNFIVTALPMSTTEEDVIQAMTGRDILSVNLTGLSPGVQYKLTAVAVTVLEGVSASSSSSMALFITTNTTGNELKEVYGVGICLYTQTIYGPNTYSTLNVLAVSA